MVPVEQSIVYLYDKGGNIYGSVGTIRDITERKRAEEALRANEERLRSVVETARDAILTGDSSGKIISWNRAAEAIFGYSAAEVLGKSWALITPERYRKIGEGEMKRATSAAKVDNAIGQPVERIGLRRDGSEFFMEVSRAAWKAEAGTFFTAIIRDITERKQAEAELKWTMTELARSNAELEQFAYVASHDLQEPLRMVSSYTQLLAKRYKDKLDDDANEFISFAVDGATRMGGLINDLLTYSRVGTRGNDFEPVDCSDVLDQALGNLQVAIKESGAVLTHDRLPTVMADPSQLVQLFQNLIGNAIKFQDNGEAPRVHVSANQEGSEWTFSFCDNGVGIDPQFAERIFMIFQRLHGRGEYSGTGIGLAICKKIVERHEGRIWVDSEPGRGSTFYFTIPMRGGEKA
jgi:PAS domain S-box-containing protein